ncbi:MAG: hypothetical protein R3259_07435 [Salinimicrobium sediminis]|nr:hypothetical protein [Salinimicrobium sediminis]
MGFISPEETLFREENGMIKELLKMLFSEALAFDNVQRLLLFLNSLTEVNVFVYSIVAIIFNKTSITISMRRVENFVEKLSAAVGETLT